MEIDRSLDAYFPELDLGECDLAAMGLAYANISVFDRWLSEGEAESNPLMSYSIAMDAGKLDDYLAGEHKFLSLYRVLGQRGVICNRPGPLRKFDRIDAQLEQILKGSLREKRFADVHFVDFGVRVIGGYDRTDLIVAESSELLDLLSPEVAKCGLFMLPLK